LLSLNPTKVARKASGRELALLHDLPASVRASIGGIVWDKHVAVIVRCIARLSLNLLHDRGKSCSNNGADI